MKDHAEPILDYASPLTPHREWPFWFFISGLVFALIVFTLPFIG